MKSLLNCCFVLMAIWFGLVVRNVAAQPTDPPSSSPNGGQVDAIDFVRDIQPIFREHCYECHAGTTEEGGLNLGIKERAFQGGDSGSLIEAGNSEESLLLQMISGEEGERLMPPEGSQQLSDEQIELIRVWVTQGANWPESANVVNPKMDRAKTHWAFQRLTKHIVPPYRHSHDNWSKTPIDRFVYERLHKAGIRPAQPADARTLVRRLYFDLIGLPPNPEQVNDFVREYENDRDKSIEKLVNELLDSPHYGERWGRHWLDVARYADSDGQEADTDRPHAYRYRDFVINALNDDMPYDQFVRWQIAGDEYEPNSDAAVSATGFLTAGTCYKLPDSFLESERLLNRYNELDDVISTLGSGLLGITVACARCHDHKFDAFSAKDFYQLLGVFHSGDRVSAKLPSGKEGFFFQDFDRERRTTWLFRRSDFYDREIELDLGFPEMLSADADANEYWEQAKAAYSELGEPKSTLQRRALADWITNTEQGGGALLARVIVNRVWHHHFGKGIVHTTGDFGVRGDPPTHPELLEYLTDEFVRSGWELKSLHRMILTSSVWQQASTQEAVDPQGAKIDPGNRLLWKMTPVRLEAEVIRDAMLSVSDTLNLEAGGPGFKPYIAPEANLARNIQGERYPENAPDDASTRRRSIYMFHKRLIPYPMFQAFDRPDLMVSCARRTNTTVAPQAMVILNDGFVRAVARDFAERLVRTETDQPELTDDDFKPVIEQAFQLSFSRSPTEGEVEASAGFLRGQMQVRTERGDESPQLEAMTDFCQSLFGLNEFIYVN
ncbi:Planctomycete cytochrome C [Thalassoglobus neptunius]|uniref:Planctomycete cytochrome C n=1 Tax=Thalassoglobus neptunius TaxID=1938619 RepID=A0A5C5W1A4_9PLAN|nr:PSD1 and planctomycete cytochrome C domain-containing protein [Thalassoglobus neptunius]TWT43552.1 Planctomycete cytochrome C [Thalassoglobus neptunius]